VRERLRGAVGGLHGREGGRHCWRREEEKDEEEEEEEEEDKDKDKEKEPGGGQRAARRRMRRRERKPEVVIEDRVFEIDLAPREFRAR